MQEMRQRVGPRVNFTISGLSLIGRLFHWS